MAVSVYAESSALLAWLFREPGAVRVGDIMDAADVVVTSDLALIECDRAIHRQTALGRVSHSMGRRLAADLSSEAVRWTVLEFTPRIIERARQPFPVEPIRSLDALHVVWALHAKTERADLSLLSLDARVRRVGRSLGLDLLPL